MLVPIVLAAPAVIAGLCLWFDWGPQWPGLTVVLSGVLLALVLDYRRALRYGFFGILAGLATSPLLLLLGYSDWYLIATWVIGISVVPALLVPLMMTPTQQPNERSYIPHVVHIDQDAPPTQGD